MKRTALVAFLCTLMVVILRVIGMFEFSYREYVYTLVSIVLFIAGSIFLYSISSKGKWKKFYKINKLSRGNFGITISMTALVISGGFLLNLLSLTVYNYLGVSVPENSFTSLSEDNFWMSFLTVALIPAIFEELFFRGAVISALTVKINPVLAAFISSFFFAFVHGSYYYFVTNFFAGIVFGLMFVTSESLYPSIVAHFIHNLLSYSLFVYSNRIALSGMSEIAVYILGFVFLVSLYCSLSAIQRKYRHQLENETYVINEGEIIWQNSQDMKKKKNKKREKKSSGSSEK